MQRIARLLPIVLAVAIGIVLGSPRPIRAVSIQSRTTQVPGGQALLVLDRTTLARAGPSAAAAAIRLVAARTPLTLSRTVLPVIQEAVGPAGSRWLRVRLATRPNGSTGWVQASAGLITSTGWEIVVHR